MPKVPLNTITSEYGTVAALNDNFDAIEAAFDNTLSRNGDTPNQMQANLDMNGNALLNVGTINGAPITALNDISGYVNTALAAATSASASATSAANTYDLFDDRYLGSKTSNPTVDNDGNALQVGAEYWNSVSNERRTWTGSAWVSSITVVPDGSVTTSKWNSANGQIAGMRNKIINGKMDIAQRGTSISVSNMNFPGAYTLDRFGLYGNSVSATYTISQNADVPSGQTEFQNSLRVTVDSAETGGSTRETSLFTKLEGFNVRDLIGRTFTISFWVRSPKTGTHSLCFSNLSSGGSVDRSFVTTYTINSANTWEFKTITVTNGLITAGTWSWTTGVGLFIRWVLFAGSSFHTANTDSWQSSSAFSVASQPNCSDTIGNIFAITGVQLEPGSVATPFEHRPIGAELALCRRYALKLGGATANNSIVAFGTGANTTSATLFYYPQTPFRATPSLSSWDSLVIDDTDGQILISALTLDTNGSNPDLIRLNATATGLTQFRPYFLRSNTSAGNLILSAEL